MFVFVYEVFGFEFFWFLLFGFVMVSGIYMWDDDGIFWNDFFINFYIF